MRNAQSAMRNDLGILIVLAKESWFLILKTVNCES